MFLLLGGGSALAQAPMSPGAQQPAASAAPQGDYLPQGRGGTPNFVSGESQPPGSARGDQRVQDLKYWACDGMSFLPRYDARWSEDQFVLSRIDGGDTRTDAAINFVDWNMRCWTASWDPKQNNFILKRLPEENEEHTDSALHFLAHDLTPWEGYRDGQSWFVRPGRFEMPSPQSAANPAYMGY